MTFRTDGCWIWADATASYLERADSAPTRSSWHTFVHATTVEGA